MKVYTDTGKAILKAVEKYYTNYGIKNIVFFNEKLLEDLKIYVEWHYEAVVNLTGDQRVWFALIVAEQHSVDIEDILDKVFDDGYNDGRESAKEYYRNLFY